MLSVLAPDTLIHLRGISLKGKNRVKEHGSLWRITEVRDKVPALNNEAGYFIVSTTTNHGRWIKQQNDPDFKIIYEQPTML